MSGLRVNILRRDSGTGMTRSSLILRDVLEAAGHRVSFTEQHKENYRFRRAGRALSSLREAPHLLELRARGGFGRRKPFDLNIFMSKPGPLAYAAFARVNAVMPNHEWWLPSWNARLPAFDHVLCKTHAAEAAFTALGARTVYTSFTGDDRRIGDGAAHEPLSFFHLGDPGGVKGTFEAIDAWRRHPAWPTLTIAGKLRPEHAIREDNLTVRPGYLPDAELRRLQNAHPAHLCVTNAEGFGHRLVESMSCGAVTITTDGGPMNEIVQPGRGLLVATVAEQPQNLGTRYTADWPDFERQVEAVIAISPAERARIGQAGRDWFEANDRFFRRAITDYAAGL